MTNSDYDELHMNWFARGEKIQKLNHEIAVLQARCRTLERRRNVTLGQYDERTSLLEEIIYLYVDPCRVGSEETLAVINRIIQEQQA